MKVLRAFPFVVIAGLLAFVLLQKREIQRLTGLNEDVAHRLRLSEEKQTAEDPALVEELARLRKDHGELLKLRGELNLKKRQLRELQAQQPVFSPKEPSRGDQDESAPVKKYEAIAELTLKPGESAVTGGWETGPGKRGIVLASPTIINGKGEVDPSGDQITVSAQFFELPDALFKSHFILEPDGSLKQTLQDEETRRLLKELKGAEGVSALAAPRVTTANGQQAQVSVLDVQSINGKEFEIGPSLDVIPTIGANGTIHVTLIPSINVKNEPIP